MTHHFTYLLLTSCQTRRKKCPTTFPSAADLGDTKVRINLSLFHNKQLLSLSSRISSSSSRKSCLSGANNPQAVKTWVSVSIFPQPTHIRSPKGMFSQAKQCTARLFAPNLNLAIALAIGRDSKRYGAFCRVLEGIAQAKVCNELRSLIVILSFFPCLLRSALSNKSENSRH